MAAPTTAKPLKDELSLKVIRLKKPIFQTRTPLLCEPVDAAFQVIGDDGPEIEPFGLSSMMTIPPYSGKTFLGETFRSYISINNGSTNNVSNVTIEVTLSRPKRSRQTLLEVPPGSIPVFSPGDSQDFVISRDIEEEGTYTLNFRCSYIRCDGEKKTFRKCFQFDVEQPFEVSTKNYLVNNDSFVNIELKNSSVVPFCIESINFIPDEAFIVESLNNGIYEGETGDSELQPLFWLKPNQVRRYLYSVKEKDPTSSQNLQQDIGHLEIEWKSNSGGFGKIIIPPIKQSVQRTKKFQVQITNLPDVIHLEVPFKATCVIKNCSSQKLIPKLIAAVEKQQQPGIVINGVTGKSLGPVSPGESVSTEISLFPMFPGLQSVSGLCIVEQQFNKKFDFDHIVDVFVQSPQ